MKLHDYIDVENFKTSVKNYGENPPFDYAIIDNFFKPEVADQLAAEFPDFDSDKWHDYNNAIEVKKTCNNWNVFPPLTYKMFGFLNSDSFLNLLSETIIPKLPIYSDSGLNGGGWHIHRRGGKLNTHLDYSVHPKLGKQRKLNIIAYMNPNWQEDWGGALGFWDNKSADAPGDLIKSVWSKFNRAVIFDTTQNSWHGLPNPLDCPEDQYRKSLAAYFLTDAPEGVDTRGKALFSATEEQQGDADVLDLIKKRSDVGTASSVYTNDKKLK